MILIKRISFNYTDNHQYNIVTSVCNLLCFKPITATMDLFGKKPTPKEQMRQTDRVIRKTQRDMERERADLDRTEKKLELEIKQAAKAGNKQAVTVLAKQLVNLRKQKTKTYAVGSKMQAIGTQGKLMQSNMKMADAMATTTKTMVSMNKIMDPQKTAATMQEFERQNMKMEMTDEMISDSLDDILGESGDEEEQDAIVTQVLDEIGIEISGKLADAPSAGRGALGTKSKASASGVSDDDIERQLAQLKAL
jgi:charged multivesicular body protein 2B